MSIVALFREVAAATEDTLEGSVIGRTGYLDSPVRPTASAMKGVDAVGRAFITVCARSKRPSEYMKGGFEVATGVITIFQRYTDPTCDIVAQANNHHHVFFLRGAASEEDVLSLSELIGEGRTVLRNRLPGGVVEETVVELISPEEALA